LQAELLKRCRSNSSYSLRAFARALRIEPSALSKILKGSRRVTPKMFAQLAKRLGLDPRQIERLKPRPHDPAYAAPRSGGDAADYRQLTIDHFQVIAEWYHYAILELTQTRHFKSSPRWIARTLGITVSEVNAAVERLLRLGMLSIDPETGRWKDESGAITTVGNDFTAAAFRKLQTQVLQKALAALDETPFEERDQSSMTMAIDSKRLPEAKPLIRKFRRELCALLKSDGPLDRVYHLGVSLYPVSNHEEGVKS
jgi:transcriptional regulator with XRE-family HTH domain